ncbi:peptidase [Mesorhizobium sp. RP14(2022)]|uniref:Peptidase n=1 Tax=Mesorhizobium liriopis TaxID=2953882 RepID=A0ABT1C4V9_9HYPH|nr:Kazal-type serine protease inhibitor domain-containing protein [Mesorhizobium liriopis]MCO6049878.1 peptidase [Mesorhizobium liriopis]
MHPAKTLASKLGTAGLLFVLSACTVVVDEPGPVIDPGPPPGPRFCTREYAPVCGRRGPDRQTFANGCLADRAGYRIIGDGECRFGPPPRPRPPYGGGGDRFCTREYAPVCGRRGPDVRTFGNECEADSAGYRVIDRGEC